MVQQTNKNVHSNVQIQGVGNKPADAFVCFKYYIKSEWPTSLFEKKMEKS